MVGSGLSQTQRYTNCSLIRDRDREPSHTQRRVRELNFGHQPVLNQLVVTVRQLKAWLCCGMSLTLAWNVPYCGLITE